MASACPYELGQEAALLPVDRPRPRLPGRARARSRRRRSSRRFSITLGVDPVSPLYSLAFVGLARADAALGKRDDSRKAYATFLESVEGRAIATCRFCGRR